MSFPSLTDPACQMINPLDQCPSCPSTSYGVYKDEPVDNHTIYSINGSKNSKEHFILVAWIIFAAIFV